MHSLERHNSIFHVFGFTTIREGHHGQMSVMGIMSVIQMKHLVKKICTAIITFGKNIKKNGNIY